MTQIPGLKAALKRGALLAAANWQLVIIQFVAESSLKLLLAVPIIGGAFLVALLLDTSLTELLRGDVREIVTAIISALTASPAALAAFVASSLLVLLGGSAVTFVVKGGTVALLAEAERTAGPIEKPPLHLQALRRASVVAIEPFLDGSRGSGVATSGSVSGSCSSTLSPPLPILRSCSAATPWPPTRRFCWSGPRPPRWRRAP